MDEVVRSPIHASLCCGLAAALSLLLSSWAKANPCEGISFLLPPRSIYSQKGATCVLCAGLANIARYIHLHRGVDFHFSDDFISAQRLLADASDLQSRYVFSPMYQYEFQGVLAWVRRVGLVPVADYQPRIPASEWGTRKVNGLTLFERLERNKASYLGRKHVEVDSLKAEQLRSIEEYLGPFPAQVHDGDTTMSPLELAEKYFPIRGFDFILFKWYPREEGALYFWKPGIEQDYSPFAGTSVPLKRVIYPSHEEWTQVARAYLEERKGGIEVLVKTLDQYFDPSRDHYDLNIEKKEWDRARDQDDPHEMVIVGFDRVGDEIVTWHLQNSYGTTDRNAKPLPGRGYVTMSNAYLRRYNSEAWLIRRRIE